VLHLVAAGQTDRQIAGALCLSLRTVTTHVSSVLRKLDADNRTAAATMALRAGLLTDRPAS
jgi:DNA-binding NarL/FixJ family response regulator